MKTSTSIIFALCCTGVVGCVTPDSEAPETDTQAESLAGLSAAPTTSPAAASRTFSTTWGFTCESGYACALVPYSNGWYTFKFFNYGTYALSNWLGTGVGFNDQTGGAAMRLLNNGGGQIECIRGVGSDGLAHFDDNENWNPVFRIQLTPSGC